MARYSLIVRDETYFLLMQRAASEGLSLGKLLNEIIESAVAGDKVEQKCQCGAVANVKVFLEEKAILCCEDCKEQWLPMCKGWRELEK